MARKIDLSGVKDYFFNHGEKIALGSCAFLAVVLGLWGILDARSAGRTDGGKTWREAFEERVRQIQQGMATAETPKVDTSLLDEDRFKWKALERDHVPSRYSAFNEDRTDKRANPHVLPIRSEPSNIRIDYIAGLTFKHDYGYNLTQRVVRGLSSGNAEEGAPMPPPPKGAKPPKDMPAPGVIPPFVQVGQHLRMVVVQAVFPMKQQVAEFQKALRLAGQDEMFVKNPDDLPKPVGIDVLRYEVVPNGEPKVQLLLGMDTDGLKVNTELEKVLREAIYDERSPEVLKEYIFAGLITPMPKLANRPYPKFDFPGFEQVDWVSLDEAEKKDMMAGVGGAGGGGNNMPEKKGLGGLKGKPKLPAPPDKMPKVGGAADFKIKDIPENHLLGAHPVLISRLFGGKEKNLERDLNVYHVLGLKPRVIDKNNNPPADADRYFSAWSINPPEAADPGKPLVPILGQKPNVGVAPPMPTVVAYPNWERDALVRFIDVDVQPGKTYYYKIRVRLANPNYGKDDKVAYADLARPRELPPSAWVETPQKITIPPEYFVYAVDQQMVDDWAEGKMEKKGAGLTYVPSLVNSYTPFQVHQWVPKKTDNLAAAEYVIGDWVIMERQYVRRGEFIGKTNNPLFPVTVQVPVWKKERDAFEVPQNKHPDPRAKNASKGLHIDLAPEGKAPVLVDFAGGKRLTKSNTVEEETTVDALILMPDGRLKVLNSREASDPTINAAAQERQDRVLISRHRVNEIMRQGAAPNPKGLGPLPK